MQITFNTDGTFQHVGQLDMLEDLAGATSTQRASRIEPVDWLTRCAFYFVRSLCLSQLDEWTRRWRCQWRVRIIDGPVLPERFWNRADAIRAEISWLEENKL